MASVWIQERSGPPVKKVGGLSPKVATARLASFITHLRKYDGQTAKFDGPLSATIFDKDGAVIGIAYVELASPPSALETGQPRFQSGASVVKAKDGTVYTIGSPPKGKQVSA